MLLNLFLSYSPSPPLALLPSLANAFLLNRPPQSLPTPLTEPGDAVAVAVDVEASLAVDIGADKQLEGRSGRGTSRGSGGGGGDVSGGGWEGGRGESPGETLRQQK